MAEKVLCRTQQIALGSSFIPHFLKKVTEFVVVIFMIWFCFHWDFKLVALVENWTVEMNLLYSPPTCINQMPIFYGTV